MNHNRTGKLQITLLSAYISWKKLCSHTSKASSEEAKAVARSCAVKKVFLEKFQNSQESTCARVSFLIKLQAWILPLVHEISTFAIKEVFWKISHNS